MIFQCFTALLWSEVILNDWSGWSIHMFYRCISSILGTYIQGVFGALLCESNSLQAIWEGALKFAWNVLTKLNLIKQQQGLMKMAWCWFYNGNTWVAIHVTNKVAKSLAPRTTQPFESRQISKNFTVVELYRARYELSNVKILERTSKFMIISP